MKCGTRSHNQIFLVLWYNGNAVLKIVPHFIEGAPYLDLYMAYPWHTCGVPMVPIWSPILPDIILLILIRFILKNKKDTININ